MARTVKTLRGREVRYAQGSKFREQNERFIRTLGRQEEVTLLVTQDPYHSVVVAGEHRMPLPVFCELLGFKVQDYRDGPYTTYYNDAVAFLRTWELQEEPRSEIVEEREALRAWGCTGGVLWHVWVGAVASPYTHSADIWASGGSGVLNIREDGDFEFECCLPEALTTAAGLVPTNPRGFWALLATLVPVEKLQKVFATEVCG